MNAMVARSAGARLRAAMGDERPLQVVGAINAYAARMAAACGFKALYLSGGGVAANSLGVPDLGISSMDDVLIDVRRITDACELPLLVDADTGWGGAFNIGRTVKAFIKIGPGGLHTTVHALRPVDRRRGHRVALLLGLPSNERRGVRHLRGHPPRRHSKERGRPHADAGRSVQISRLSRLRSQIGCAVRRGERNMTGERN